MNIRGTTGTSKLGLTFSDSLCTLNIIKPGWNWTLTILNDFQSLASDVLSVGNNLPIVIVCDKSGPSSDSSVKTSILVDLWKCLRVPSIILEGLKHQENLKVILVRCPRDTRAFHTFCYGECWRNTSSKARKIEVDSTQGQSFVHTGRTHLTGA